MKYVFSTEGGKPYRFPTHTNELVIDRSEATVSEVFMVDIEPGKGPPLHSHTDAEQVYYVVEGEGILTIGEGENQQRFPVKPGDAVLVPPLVMHAITTDKGRIRYFAVDSFVSPDAPNEPTWDEHARAVCDEMGWDYDTVVG